MVPNENAVHVMNVMHVARDLAWMPFALVFWSVVKQKTLVAIACHVSTIDANLLA